MLRRQPGGAHPHESRCAWLGEEVAEGAGGPHAVPLRFSGHGVQSGPTPSSADRDIIVFRDRAVEIERAAALVYEDAKNGMDFAIARETEEQSQSSQRMAISAHRLNVLAAFFFPLATLGAIFGMNLKIGLEEEVFPIPFLIVLVFGLIAGLVIKSFIGQGLKKSDGAAD